MSDPYIPFIVDTLSNFDTLPASRLFDMVRERGTSGSRRATADGSWRATGRNGPRRRSTDCGMESGIYRTNM